MVLRTSTDLTAPSEDGGLDISVTRYRHTEAPGTTKTTCHRPFFTGHRTVSDPRCAGL